MLLNDFLAVTTYLRDFLGDGRIVALHQELLTLINADRTTSTPASEQQIEAKAAEIVAEASKFDFANVNYPGIERVINELGLIELSGDRVSQFVSQTTEIIASPSKLQAQIDKLTKTRDAVSQLSTAFNQLQITSTFDSLSEEDKGVIDFVYKDDIPINDLGRLSLETAKLRKHMAALARLLPPPVPPDPELMSLSKSSPFEARLIIDLKLLALANTVIAGILGNLILVKKLQKHTLELEREELLTEQLREAFKKEENDKAKQFAEAEAKRLYDEMKPSTENGAEEEIKKAVEDAINYLHNFLHQGGEVDIVRLSAGKPEGAPKTETQEIRVQQKEIGETLRAIRSLTGNAEADEPASEASPPEPETTPAAED